MNIDPPMVFDMWACFQHDISQEEVNREFYRWQKFGKVSASVESFCLDILTDRIPLIAVPIPKQKARNKLKD